jgi:hypothetical protein
VLIAVFLKCLFINLELSSVKTFLELLKTTLNLEDRTLGGLFLYSETVNLLLDFFEVLLLSDNKLFNIIVLLLDLSEFN